MHSIQIPAARYQDLSQQATAAGFAEVADYVLALADDAAFDPRAGMSNEQVQASAQACDAILSRMKQSDTALEFRDAWGSLGAEMGFPKPE